MVKTGEVYRVNSTDIKGVYCCDESKPRNVSAPAGIGYTLRAAVQEQLWHLVEQAFPEFYHGWSSEMVAKKMEELGDELTCLDGSSFEGSQFADLREAIETAFWKNDVV